MSDVVLSVTSLTKSFPGKFNLRKFRRGPIRHAVKGLSFSIAQGEIVGLLGPNGAGKTTTIQMLLGTTTKTSGDISYFGLNFDHHRSEILEQMNYASAYTKLPWHMTVYENLMVYAMLYHVSNPKNRIAKLLAEFNMVKHINAPIRELSAGQNTRVLLAKSFLNYPKLILLDEPTASLDPESAANVRKFLLKQQREYRVAMLFTSHNMAEVTEVCDRVLFINHGTIVAEDTPEALARKIDDVKIHLTLNDNSPLTITCKENQVAAKLQDLAKRGVEYTQIVIDKPTLEDYFIHTAARSSQLGAKL